MRNLCESCKYAEWDTVEYHSAKECGLSGGNARALVDCRKSEEMTDRVAKEWSKDYPEITYCHNYEEIRDE